MATYFDDLDDTTPINSDKLSTFVSHARNIKRAFRDTLPNVDGPVLATDAELNHADGVTSAIQTQLQIIALDVVALQLNTRVLLLRIVHTGFDNYSISLPNGWAHTFVPSGSGFVGAWNIHPPADLVIQQTGDNWMRVILSSTAAGSNTDVEPTVLDVRRSHFSVTLKKIETGRWGRPDYGVAFTLYGVITYDPTGGQVLV